MHANSGGNRGPGIHGLHRERGFDGSAKREPCHMGNHYGCAGYPGGHFRDKRRPTGCTAILFDTEASGSVDYDGSAPGSSLGVLLQPVSPFNTIHAMLLTGGGVLALPDVAGVTRYLQEPRIGTTTTELTRYSKASVAMPSRSCITK
jgi:L-aminopeptidase/D-esterase-like protein